MQFESWSAFWEMGGYGFFVWLSFGVTFVSMALMVLQTAMERRQLQKSVVETHARKARIKAAAEVQL